MFRELRFLLNQIDILYHETEEMSAEPLGEILRTLFLILDEEVLLSVRFFQLGKKI